MRVLEVFGGQSAEHDVSVASGWAVAGGLREAGHHVTAAHIDRGGRWRAIELDGQLPAIPQPLEWPDADRRPPPRRGAHLIGEPTRYQQLATACQRHPKARGAS